MAAYVKMIKVMDDINKVIYKFGPNEQNMGEIEFDKQRLIIAFCHEPKGKGHLIAEFAPKYTKGLSDIFLKYAVRY